MPKDFRPFVFGVGLSRTGTTSLAAALEILGFKTCHGGTCWDPGQEMWQYALYQDDEIVRQFQCSGYDAWVCWPAHAYERFHHYYPEALWIHTTRPTDEWVEAYLLYIVNEVGISEKASIRLMSRKRLAGLIQDFKIFGYRYQSRPTLRTGYDKFNHKLQQFFLYKGAKLLTYDVIGGDGWGPLCRFLDVERPNVPFPHRNRRDGKGLRPAPDDPVPVQEGNDA